MRSSIFYPNNQLRHDLGFCFIVPKDSQTKENLLMSTTLQSTPVTVFPHLGKLSIQKFSRTRILLYVGILTQEFSVSYFIIELGCSTARHDSLQRNTSRHSFLTEIGRIVQLQFSKQRNLSKLCRYVFFTDKSSCCKELTSGF